MSNLWTNSENIEHWLPTQNQQPQEKSIGMYLEAYMDINKCEEYQNPETPVKEKKKLLVQLLGSALKHTFDEAFKQWKIPVTESIRDVVINADTTIEQAEQLLVQTMGKIEEAKNVHEFTKSTLIAQPNEKAVTDLTAQLMSDDVWEKNPEWMSRKDLAHAVIDRLAKEYTMLQPQIDKLKEIVTEYSSKDYYKLIKDYITKKKLATVDSIKKIPQQLRDKMSSFVESIKMLRQKKTADKVIKQLDELRRNKDREWGLKYLHLKSWITKTKIWFMFAKLQTRKLSDASNKKKRELSIKLVKDITDRFKLFPWIYTLAMDIANGYLDKSTIQLLTREDIYWKTGTAKKMPARKEEFTSLKKAS